MRPESDSAHPVLRPGFVIAVVVLLLNDHVLKGSGFLPNPVTGKLSDFAGLVVLPVLLCQLPGANGPRVRLAICVLVGTLFSALNLVPALSALFGALYVVPGMGSRLWADPTDLVALPMLFVAHRMADADRHPGPHAVARSLIVVAALACMATPDGDDPPAPADCRDGSAIPDGCFCVSPSPGEPATRLTCPAPSGGGGADGIGAFDNPGSTGGGASDDPGDDRKVLECAWERRLHVDDLTADGGSEEPCAIPIAPPAGMESILDFEIELAGFRITAVTEDICDRVPAAYYRTELGGAWLCPASCDRFSGGETLRVCGGARYVQQ